MPSLNKSIFLALLSATILFAGCDSNDDPGQCDVDFATEDLIVGDGAEAVLGRRLTVEYTGYYCDAEASDLKGAIFDATGEGSPYRFVLGAGQVIDGWDDGIPGMKVGGRRRLTIPPDRAYGRSGYLEIPPNATLVFEVDLLGVE